MPIKTGVWGLMREAEADPPEQKEIRHEVKLLYIHDQESPLSPLSHL